MDQSIRRPGRVGASRGGSMIFMYGKVGGGVQLVSKMFFTKGRLRRI